MSVSAATHFGSGLYQSSAVNLTISRGNGKVRSINMTTAGKSVSIEALTNWRYKAGDELFVIYNIGANAFAIKDSAGTTLLASLAPGDVATVDLYSISPTTHLGSFGVEVRTPV